MEKSIASVRLKKIGIQTARILRFKALHKMTENRTVSLKNEQDFIEKPVRAKLSFSIPEFFSKKNFFEIQAWKKMTKIFRSTVISNRYQNTKNK
jgi:hypothetical protein